MPLGEAREQQHGDTLLLGGGREDRRASLTRLSALSFTDTVCLHGRQSGKFTFQLLELVKKRHFQDVAQRATQKDYISTR